MNLCMVNAQGEMLEIIQVDREPLEGEFKVTTVGYYEVLNEQRYSMTIYDFDIKTWVGVGEPIPIPAPEPTEVDLLKAQLSEQNQMVSDLMELLFTTVPELSGL